MAHGARGSGPEEPCFEYTQDPGLWTGYTLDEANDTASLRRRLQLALIQNEGQRPQRLALRFVSPYCVACTHARAPFPLAPRCLCDADLKHEVAEQRVSLLLQKGLLSRRPSSPSRTGPGPPGNATDRHRHAPARELPSADSARAQVPSAPPSADAWSAR